MDGVARAPNPRREGFKEGAASSSGAADVLALLRALCDLASVLATAAAGCHLPRLVEENVPRDELPCRGHKRTKTPNI
eukprot:9372310-Alexandrium_andersonii.AAC.1